MAYAVAPVENPRFREEGKIPPNWGPVFLEEDTDYDKHHIG